AARPGTISVGNQSFTINQAGACAISLSPSSASFTAGAGTGGFNVTATSGCAWTAVKSDTWISITAGASGSGNGSVSFSIEANTGRARAGSITVGDKSFTINQANGCTFSIALTSTTIPVGGGQGSFNVTAGVGCG